MPTQEHSYFSRELLDEVIARCADLLNARPQDPQLMRDMGLAEMQRGNFDAALGVFQRMLALAPSDTAAMINAGRCHLAMGQGEDAERAFNEAMRQKPDWPDVYYWLARVYFATGRYPDARTNLQMAVTKNPKYRDAHFLLGEVHEKSGALPNAVACYKKVIELLEPEDRAPFPYEMKYFFDDPILLEEIIRQLTGFLAQNPEGYADLHFKLGMAYRHKGMREESLAEFAKAIRINPQYHLARHYYWHWDQEPAAKK